MNKYRIAWPKGEATEELHELDMEGFVNERFGSQFDTFLADGGTVEKMDEVAAPADPAPVPQEPAGEQTPQV